jgi:hypothetical protein
MAHAERVCSGKVVRIADTDDERLACRVALPDLSPWLWGRSDAGAESSGLWLDPIQV